MNVTNAQDFIAVRNSHFVKNTQPYYVIGTNFWYGMNLASTGAGGDRMRLIAELNQLQDLGINNLRIMAASEGPDNAPFRMSPTLQAQKGQYNQLLLEGLDFLLVEMAKREMTAVICLNNFWPWSGGMAQYVAWEKGKAIPYPPPAKNGSWWTYMNYAAQFYKNKAAQAAFQAHIQTIITRKNTLSGQFYKNDPTIMSWQLANEPRGMLKPYAYRRWIKKTAQFIKALDKNHLLCIGSEGNTSTPTGNHFRKDHQFKAIDYTTIHIWIQNWGWYNPLNAEKTYPKAWDKAKTYIQKHLVIAQKLNKPMVLEEFGIARDQDNHHPEATTQWRDRYYQAIFEEIYQAAKAGSPLAGGNFWAWGGQGRPKTPQTLWQVGDDFIGDPPHEFQGWYSVYQKDASTLQVIRSYAKKMQALQSVVPYK